MISIPLSDLLIEAPARRHFAQLYRELEPLGRAVETYVETGIRRGASLVLLTCQETRDVLLENLQESGIDVEASRKSGRLTLLAAEQVRASIMRGIHTDRQAFFEIVRPVLERAARRGSSSTRVYGELVNLLWRDGLAEAASEIEGYWNEIMQTYPVSVFCSYLLTGDGTELSTLHEICRQHTDVIVGGPGQPFESDLSDIDDGHFGVHIGELCDYAINGGDGSATRLWLIDDLAKS